MDLTTVRKIRMLDGIMISTVHDLIERLGGSKDAAETFKVRKSAISFWRVSNDLPLWARHRAKQIAEASGFVLHPDLVAFKPRVQYGTGPHATKKRKTASRSRPKRAA